MQYRIASLDLKALIHEVVPLLEGAFIRNIYQKDNAFLFKLWTRSGIKHLLIEAEKRANLTKIMETGEATELAKGFRKHLRGKRLNKIEQHKLDRILELQIGRDYTLIVEFFRRGNLVLLRNGKIILAQKHQHMRDRDLYPGVRYDYPPQSPADPLNLDNEQFTLKLRERRDLVRGLVSFFGPKYAEEICYRASIEKNFPSEKLKEHHVERILAVIAEISSKIIEEPEPKIYYSENEIPKHVTPILFSSLRKFPSKTFPSFSEAIDEFFINRKEGRRDSESGKKVEDAKEKLLARIEDQKEKISSFKRQAYEYREKAKTIYNHLRELTVILEEIKRAKKEENRPWGEISQKIGEQGENYKIEEIHQDGNVIVNVDHGSLTLHIMEAPQERAERYFKKAKKMEKRFERAKEALAKSKKELQQVKQEWKEAEEKEEIVVKRPEREWYESFRWFESSDGLLVVAGRNAKTNEKLINHHMEKGDLFLHAETHGGAATIIKKGEKRQIPNNTIEEAATFAASFSSAWKEGFAGVDVYYSPAEKVTTSPPSGQYLPKGGFMIKEKYYLKNIGLKTAVGVIVNDLSAHSITVREIGGPPNVVSKQTDLFVIIKPGRYGKGEIAKKVKAKLKFKAKSKKEKKALDQLKKEKFLRFIPSNSKIEA
ncbi:MAG: fibronectin-binding domain-containing protein [Candidatus Korarchaeota archaeon]|nr:fibronectin-binding domain-containing protein [Candidatus Korarchaeota archaeon]NIU83453.1 DUF814 domain-containing protein [Candidatus Thorarchaeota archaeon]NIW13729.1 DUF814 domain-containing protein [Candidatus Thorarchaeota archaeon]NIW51824.1 DUF814 domain-containing protein [Candidatus Korarchaeota archaeon]